MSSSLNGFSSFASGAMPPAAAPKLLPDGREFCAMPHDEECGGERKGMLGDIDMLVMLKVLIE